MGSECEAYPMEMEDEEEQNEELLQSCCCPLFRFYFQIDITHVPYDEESGELFVDDSKIAVKEYMVWAASDQMGVKLVSDFLEEMCIPPEPHVVRTILDCAQHMITDERFNKRKILNMFVAIDVPGSGQEEDLVYYANQSWFKEHNS